MVNRARARLVAAVAVAAATWASAPARADAPSAMTLPARLGLAQAIALVRERGLDALLADEAVEGARGDLDAAGALPNPAAGVALGPTYDYSAAPPCSGCTRLGLTWSADDEGALVAIVAGKRALRVVAARAALESAAFVAEDVRRVLEGTVARAYVAIAAADVTVRATQEIAASYATTLAATRALYPTIIDEGGLARVEAQAMESDQAVAGAIAAARQARVALAFLLGSRAVARAFEVDPVLDALSPIAPEALDEDRLRAKALAARPDVLAARKQRTRSAAALEGASRARVPDVAFGLAFAGVSLGQQGASPATLGPTLASTLPILYQQQGEILRARSDQATQALLEAKAAAMVATDVAGAVAAYRIAHAVTKRLDDRLVERARVARDRTVDRFRAGAVPLTDVLDAERSYAGVRLEQIAARAALWTAYYQLRQSVGGPLS